LRDWPSFCYTPAKCPIQNASRSDILQTMNRAVIVLCVLLLVSVPVLAGETVPVKLSYLTPDWPTGRPVSNRASSAGNEQYDDRLS